MSIYIPPLPQPVVSDYNGDALNMRVLRDFCSQTTAAFSVVAQEFHSQGKRVDEQHHINTKLVQFMNWIAVTNPQILDEFQATSNAFEKLAPRDAGDGETACAQA